ncbi:hypothetical protein [Flavobacterium urocaniciphilum]|uniref:Uncharacterized protein n=1 Tax=Flavobacterium urocaniciphilum TaxID=1299341 RepID=A0A1H9AUZ5_9FLAO|nr:hypothetical protein [Flavobacterium urocaniciphilum]SEP80355.1 hypothetical protein SAMN05444005_102345 [Flavobacterium urocaniciphilum]
MTNNLRIKLLLIFCSIGSFAQVGIGNTTPQGALEITSTTDGLIIPRVALTNTTTATIITPTKSELVYNTATAGDVTPGYYYWETTPTVASDRWVRLMISSANNDWSLTGNSGTTAGTNFIGTTDAQDLRFKTQGTDRLNISNTNGQLQSYYAGAAGTPAFSWNADPNTGVFRSAADNISLTTNGTEGLRLRENSNVSIGATYASTNAAPTNGLRVEGNTVIGKASGEDSRDILSSNTSATAFQNITGYPNSTKKRAISGYADDSGIGIFGFSNRTGYGVVGLTQPGTISSYVQTGEGVLGQADGASGVTTIPIGVHGIIDETASGLATATSVLGENNNITRGTGLSGGAYNSSSKSIAGVYGNFATRSTPAGTDAYQFGVVGDILLLGVASQPDATGGVLGTNAAGDFGLLGYVSKNGTNYSIYAGNNNTDYGSGNGRNSVSNKANNIIGLGVNGGFMGGYVKGNQYGLVSKGDEFGMYVQGNTITNQPIIQLTETSNNEKAVSYTATSTEVDVTTRGVGKLTNGESFISFKESFKNLVSEKEGINITITPTGESKGVYVSNVTKEGFYVKENMNGTSNVAFNWTAIGTRAGFENGVEISETILAKDFDKNINGVMNNDGGKEEGTPIYFDGNKVKFERIPEGIIKYNKKETSKRN